MIKIGLNEIEFEDWKEEWNLRIPKCKNFICCHELNSCAVDRLCSQGSMYETYKRQTSPIECDGVSCGDCMRREDCNGRKMSEKIIDCDPNDEGADCDNCPNPCSWIDCEYCICPMECPSFKRSNLLTIGRLTSRGFDPHDD